MKPAKCGGFRCFRVRVVLIARHQIPRKYRVRFWNRRSEGLVEAVGDLAVSDVGGSLVANRCSGGGVPKA